MRESRILKRDVNGEMDAGEGREMCGEGRDTLRGRGGGNSTGGERDRGEGKERKDERLGEKHRHEKEEQSRIGETPNLMHPLAKQNSLSAALFHPPRRMLTFSSSPVQEAPRCVSCLCLTRGIMGVEVQSI